VDEYIEMMKKIGVDTDKRAGWSFGEGFRQHLGHGYPQENVLKKELGELVNIDIRKQQ